MVAMSGAACARREHATSFYTADITNSVREHLTIEAELRAALEREGQAIVKAMISMAHALGLRVWRRASRPRPSCSAWSCRAAMRCKASCSDHHNNRRTCWHC